GAHPLKVDAALSEDLLGAPVRRIADIPVSRAAGGHLDPIGKAPLRHAGAQDRFGHRRTADISQANKQDSHLVHLDTSSRASAGKGFPALACWLASRMTFDTLRSEERRVGKERR